MKQHLDEAVKNMKNVEALKNDFMQKLKVSEENLAQTKKKHDEMFSSVSSLNKRIEELEMHKLHLLEKLKAQGDKGSLDYIVKTQGLENVKGIEL